MNPVDLNIFLSSCVKVFENLTQSSAKMGMPHLLTPRDQFSDLTGTIEMSGTTNGIVNFSASTAMLKQFLQIVYGYEPEGDEPCRDAIGEITNTIAGNALKVFKNSKISPPRVDSVTPIQRPPYEPALVVPIHWYEHQPLLLVALGQS